jgi:hypothetical protein
MRCLVEPFPQTSMASRQCLYGAELRLWVEVGRRHLILNCSILAGAVDTEFQKHEVPDAVSTLLVVFSTRNP